MAQDSMTFPGFDAPTANFSKLPHQLINTLPQIETFGELKVILYILRHTWGFQERQKKITMDEFEHGRKRRDRTRMDAGTGLTNPTIRDGLKRAEAHGFIEVEVDDRDLGRVKRYYSLRMNKPQESPKESQPLQKENNERDKKICPRTGKDTVKKDTPRKSDITPQATLVGVDPPEPKPKRKSRVSAGKGRKPANVPPAVEVVKEETGYYPRRSWFRDLDEQITDLDRWRKVVHAWVGTPWSPKNIQGMLECYIENRLPTTKGAQHVQSVGRSKHHQEATPETVAAFRAHFAAERRAAGVEEVRANPGAGG